MDEPRKVNPESVAIIGTHGEVVKESKAKAYAQTAYQQTAFGNIRVIKGGPWLLLLLPVIIPILIVATFFMAILALFFGSSVFKIATKGLRKQ